LAIKYHTFRNFSLNELVQAVADTTYWLPNQRRCPLAPGYSMKALYRPIIAAK